MDLRHFRTFRRDSDISSPSILLEVPSGLAGRIARWLAALIARLREDAERRANQRALRGLSDAQLKDIGLGKSEIFYAASSAEFERDRERLRDHRPRRSVRRQIGRGSLDGLEAHLAVEAGAVPPRRTASNYPEVFARRMAGRIKRPLGERFGLRNFGVNLTTLAPGGVTALHHRHSAQDEFVFVLEGEPDLVTDHGRERLGPGFCAGFPAGGTAHHLVNTTDEYVLLLEVGDRAAGDTVCYPSDDLVAVLRPDGGWRFTRKDGTPYEEIHI
jgi:uncharacterized cupin superfamily protein/uncharacterized protein YjiS (DUF1127 family)